MINADSLISDKVIDSGIVNPAAAAKGCGDVKVGLAERYVFSGFAYIGVSHYRSCYMTRNWALVLNWRT